MPLILEANGSEVLWRRQWSSLRFARLSAACERLLLRSADRVVAVSENARQALIEAGADPQHVDVVPNAVDVDRFAEAEPRRIELPPDGVVICFCGLFYRWHGVPTLAEAFVRVHRRLPATRLLLVGSGDQEASVRSILRESGVLDAVTMPGLVPPEEVPAYPAAADILVSPHADVKDFIGSPIKVFEYMASGRPIVASRVGQIETILRDEETALLVPPGSSEALADGIERLVRDEELRRRLGERAQRVAREEHTWDARLAAILGSRRTVVAAGPMGTQSP